MWASYDAIVDDASKAGFQKCMWGRQQPLRSVTKRRRAIFVGRGCKR